MAVNYWLSAGRFDAGANHRRRQRRRGRSRGFCPRAPRAQPCGDSVQRSDSDSAAGAVVADGVAAAHRRRTPERQSFPVVTPLPSTPPANTSRSPRSCASASDRENAMPARRDFIRELTSMLALAHAGIPMPRERDVATDAAAPGLRQARAPDGVVGIQMGPHTILDEGIEHTLDLVQKTAAINVVMPYSHGYNNAFVKPLRSRADHGVPLAENRGRKFPLVWVNARAVLQGHDAPAPGRRFHATRSSCSSATPTTRVRTRTIWSLSRRRAAAVGERSDRGGRPELSDRVVRTRPDAGRLSPSRRTTRTRIGRRTAAGRSRSPPATR